MAEGSSHETRRVVAEVGIFSAGSIVVMLVCVALGALLGALALSLPIYKMRREVAQLRRLSPLPSTSESSAERMANAARQSGAVAELGTGERP